MRRRAWSVLLTGLGVVLVILASVTVLLPRWLADCPAGRFVPHRLAQPTSAPPPPTGVCTVYSGSETGTYAAFPAIARTAAGRTLAVWRAADGHQTAGGAVRLAELGADNCQWSTSRDIVVPRPGYTANPAGMVELADGTLVVGIVEYRALSATSARDFRSYVVRSHDGGATWSPLTPVTAGFGAQSYPSSLAIHPDGSLLTALYGNDDPSVYSGWYVRFARSIDGGQTWAPWSTPLHNTTVTPETPATWTEPVLLVDGERLLVSLRFDSTSAEPSGAFLAESTDGGASWSVPVRATSNTSGEPALGRLPDGRFVLAYRDMANNGAFRYATSDDARTWTPGHDLTGGSLQRMLYADFTALSASETLVVYALENPESDPNAWASVYSTVLH